MRHLKNPFLFYIFQNKKKRKIRNLRVVRSNNKQLAE